MKTLFIILLLSIPTFAQIDYSAKAEDNTPFRQMFNAPTIGEKKAIWRTLSKPEQDDARRQNFSWGMEYLRLTAEQTGFLYRFEDKLPSITQDEIADFEAEALTIFPKKKRDVLFGSIGPFQPSCGMVKIRFMKPECWCSVGSYFNMACEDTCSGQNGGCNVTPDGCGFAWTQSCNGGCMDGQPHNDLNA